MPLSSNAGRSGQAHLAGAVVLVVAVVLAVHAPAPLPAQPVDAPSERFSAWRARAHLEQLAAAPRPVGSIGHRQAREYLLRTLRALGVEPEVRQQAVLIPPEIGVQEAGTVQNVLARLPGRQEGGPAVLVLAHYDSVPTGPGASDDGAGVAAMLETLRALRAGPPLDHDVLFLFTDGEELGGLGSEAFRRTAPEMRRVAVVLNFEARGSRGPSLMFETGVDNAWLVEALAETGARPTATSASAEVYRLLTNDTDFTTFRVAGLPGLNFGYIDGYLHYHTQLDDLARLDVDSLQHQGEQMLGMVRRLGDADLAAPHGSGDAVYFNVGRLFVHYRARWAVPLFLVTAALALVLVGRGIRRGQLRPGWVALGLLTALVLAAVSAELVDVSWLGLRAVHVEYRALPQNTPYHGGGLYLLAFASLALALGAGGWWLLSRRARPAELAAGALLLWLAVAGALTFTLVGVSFLFVWPALLLGVPVLALLLRSPEGTLSAPGVLLLCGCAVPVLLMVVPVLLLLNVALAFVSAGAMALLVSLLLSLLMPVILALVGGARRVLPGVALAAALLLTIAAGWHSGFNREDRRPESLRYLLDADRGLAFFATTDKQWSDWTRPLVQTEAHGDFLAEYFPNTRHPARLSPAPAVSLPAPTLEVVRDVTVQGERTLVVRMASRREAPQLELQVRPASAVRQAVYVGQSLTPDALRPRREGGPVMFWYWAPGPEGAEVTLHVDPAAAMALRVSDVTFALPDLSAHGIPARPPEEMPTPFGFGLEEGTQVTRALRP